MLDLMQGLENYKVYHYTDLNAFINIIRNEDIVLRATNCLYLNDSNEIVEGVKSVERVIQKKIDVQDKSITSEKKKSRYLCCAPLSLTYN